MQAYWIISHTALPSSPQDVTVMKLNGNNRDGAVAGVGYAGIFRSMWTSVFPVTVVR